MPVDPIFIISKKAMAYDLIVTLEANKEKTQYTTEEIKEIIRAYISGLAQ